MKSVSTLSAAWLNASLEVRVVLKLNASH